MFRSWHTVVNKARLFHFPGWVTLDKLPETFSDLFPLGKWGGGVNNSISPKVLR